MKCLFTKAAGFHPVKLRLTRSDLKEPVYEIDIDWRKENDVWCAVRLETISRPPEERWSRSRMVLDKIAVNPKIEEREFKLDLAPGTRIIDRTGADVEVRYAK
jgi:hypothetical protein